jgi:ribosomal-protein-alanine N-acetyltransferase
LQKTYRLRKFNINDLEKIVYINRICLPENYSNSFFIDLHKRFPETFIVAEENGDIVGYILCRIETSLEKFGFGGLIKKGHIVSVAVLPEYRKRGIGQGLLTLAMKNMPFYNAKRCYLEVRVSNLSAIKVYQKLGLQIVRTIRSYYSDGENAYVMSRNLLKK